MLNFTFCLFPLSFDIFLLSRPYLNSYSPVDLKFSIRLDQTKNLRSHPCGSSCRSGITQGVTGAQSSSDLVSPPQNISFNLIHRLLHIRFVRKLCQQDLRQCYSHSLHFESSLCSLPFVEAFPPRHIVLTSHSCGEPTTVLRWFAL